MAAGPVTVALSRAGEHSSVWLLLAAAGAAADRERRQEWLRAGGTVALAHGASIVLKRVVRTRRPAAADRQVAVRSEWSFPSSHATGSAAAAVAFRGLVPGAVRWPLATGVAWSRVRLGVHHRRDVAGGAALGLAAALWRARGERGHGSTVPANP